MNRFTVINDKRYVLFCVRWQWVKNMANVMEITIIVYSITNRFYLHIEIVWTENEKKLCGTVTMNSITKDI